MTPRSMKVDLDLRGLKCPLPALRTRKALRRLDGGGELTVHATDPLSPIDIPHLVATEGATLLGMNSTRDTFTFHIRKA